MSKELNASQKQLRNDLTMEVTEERLNEILEAELSKPEEEIDMRLVDEILSELEPREVSEGEIDASWKRLEGKLEATASASSTASAIGKPCTAKEKAKKSVPPTIKVLRSIGFVAAAIVVLFFVSLGTAKATRWTFLLKLLNPLAETFGISLDELKSETDPAEAYASILDDQKMKQFLSEDEIPEKYMGYRIKLDHIPERFTYTDGQFYPNEQMDTFNFLYLDGEKWLQYSVNIFETDEVGLQYMFETTLEETGKSNIGMIELTFYHNGNEDETELVSWVDRNAHYSLAGYITMEELTDIINGIQ